MLSLGPPESANPLKHMGGTGDTAGLEEQVRHTPRQLVQLFQADLINKQVLRGCYSQIKRAHALFSVFSVVAMLGDADTLSKSSCRVNVWSLLLGQLSLALLDESMNQSPVFVHMYSTWSTMKIMMLINGTYKTHLALTIRKKECDYV